MPSLRLTTVLAVAAFLCAVGPAVADPAEAVPVLETESNFDDDAGGDADADDPAIWVHPDQASASLVLGTLKDAGLSVFDLDGRTLQHIRPPSAPGPDDAPGRFNNVDVVYGVRLGTTRIDVAVVTDRGRDQLRFYRIDPKAARRGRAPLIDITAPDVPFVFSADQAEVNEATTGYGLAAWRYAPLGRTYAVVSRRHRTELANVRIRSAGGGLLTYTTSATTFLPSSFILPGGATWTPCADPGDLPQVEGMVVDVERGILFAAQEDVGLWRLPLSGDGGFGPATPVDRVRGFGVPATYDEATEECVADGPDPGVGGTHLSATPRA